MRLYKALLRLYPSGFRAEYGRDMSWLFAARRTPPVGARCVGHRWSLVGGGGRPLAQRPTCPSRYCSPGFEVRRASAEPGTRLRRHVHAGGGGGGAADGVGASAAGNSSANERGCTFIMLRCCHWSATTPWLLGTAHRSGRARASDETGDRRKCAPALSPCTEPASHASAVRIICGLEH